MDKKHTHKNLFKSINISLLFKSFVNAIVIDNRFVCHSNDAKGKCNLKR